MNKKDIAKTRLENQQIAAGKFTSPSDLVSWMGAMQAQDYNMVKWAIGLRLQDSDLEDIEKAIERGEIIRTHLLRPTWHFVTADDLPWLTELTAPQLKSGLRTRHKELGLTAKVISKSNKIIREALEGGKQLTRKELNPLLEAAGFRNENNLFAHLLLLAELDGLICSGATKGNQHTYALLNERIPAAPKLTRDDALEKLARSYFTSHGPATLEDFTWWSGLPLKDARNALEMIGNDFISEEVGQQTYWLSENISLKDEKNTVHLLPAYDEFLISYKNRSASITATDQQKAISNNGIFRPVIIVNGEVAGIWKRTVKPAKVVIETTFFKKQTKKVMEQTGEAAKQFALFLGKKPEIRPSVP
ncbi:Winged helix DNA-binding domain-containing protein [Tangfeifania diversioriginum]|uniref:Winged helix DNA-binding domain-containing protein n=1 Tax=Tangfeifania diversioriginum TaxID=1168035 RepID=A0A1M6GAU2_9BACT|nr:winged helix DNA-binding domain-containing protein [Tangfeifania diversioriginum]SHJ06989.1 Winged helix DNA-binding domain-containing protein [Tangfeifania diversioriginum]